MVNLQKFLVFFYLYHQIHSAFQLNRLLLIQSFLLFFLTIQLKIFIYEINANFILCFYIFQTFFWIFVYWINWKDLKTHFFNFWRSIDFQILRVLVGSGKSGIESLVISHYQNLNRFFFWIWMNKFDLIFIETVILLYLSQIRCWHV